MIGWLIGYAIGPVDDFAAAGHDTSAEQPFVRNIEPKLQQSRSNTQKLGQVRQTKPKLTY